MFEDSFQVRMQIYWNNFLLFRNNMPLLLEIAYAHLFL